MNEDLKQKMLQEYLEQKERDEVKQKMIAKFLDLHGTCQSWIDRFVTGACLGTRKNLYATGSLVGKALEAKVPGCLVECGVFAGSHPAVMQYMCRLSGSRRLVYLFDSFEGIPKAGPKDGEDIAPLVGRVEGAQVVHSEGRISACSLEAVKLNMSNWGAEPQWLRFVKGWFQNTVPVTDTGPIAVLRLDGDLYESTKVCMKHLHPKVSPGGFVIIDDYRLQGVRVAICEVLGHEPDVMAIPGAVTGAAFWRV